MSMKRKTHPLAARIRQMMKADDDVGKIAQATPVLLGRAVELFLQRLTEGMVGTALARNNKTLSPAHLKAYVNTDNVMDFLKQIVASAPDMPEETDEPKPKAKRKRKAAGDDEGAASPKAAKPRARKSKPKAKAKPGADEEEEEAVKEEEDAAAGSPLPDRTGNGEDVLKEEKGGLGVDDKDHNTAEAAAASAPPTATMFSPPVVPAAAVPEEDDYDDLDDA